MKKIRKINYVVWVLGFLELIVAVYLGLQVYSMIPTLYLWMLGAAELVFVLLAALSVKRTWSAVVMSILAAILTVLILIGCSVLGEVDEMLDKVTDNASGETIDMAVIVNKEDEAEVLTDIAGYRVGYLSEKIIEGAAGTMERLDAELDGSVEYVEYENIVSMLDDLFEGEVGALIINSAYLAILEEQDDYTDIYDRIKILATFMIDGTYYIPEDFLGTETEESSDTEEGSGSEEVDSEGTGSGSASSGGSHSGNSGSGGGSLGWHNYGPTGLLGHSGESAIKDGTFLVYISGIDTTGNPNTRYNSDANILVAVNTKTKTVQLVDTPRDFYIPLAHTKGNLDKLTHAGCHSVNSSVITLEMLYGINIDYYVKVNFSGFKEIIDALGGIEVYSEYAFGDFVKVGYNHFNGLDALKFCAERKLFPTGVHQRGKHQMEVVNGIIKKISSPEVLVNYADILKAISGSFVTNFSSEEVYALVKGELENPGAWKVQTYSAYGTNGSDYCYTMPGIKTYVMIPNYDTVETAKQKLRAVLQ